MSSPFRFGVDQINPRHTEDSTDAVVLDVAAAVDRLEAKFGREPIHALLRNFERQLQDACKALDTGGAPALAHRIAGTAGTLGFVDLGQAWLTLGENDESAFAPVRDITRTSLMILAARLRSEPYPSTSV